MMVRLFIYVLSIDTYVFGAVKLTIVWRNLEKVEADNIEKYFVMIFV